ncbi:MAG: methyltransferase domain-containing protein [Chloroflexi bacterium]|nr:methyltransferase domain-containing protein [Chloroflexota bacterium]
MNQRRFGGEIERLRAPQRVERLEVERVVGLCLDGLVNAQSALDIGTGSGIFAEAFAAKGLQVAGIDLREDMLEAARSYVPSGDFRLAHMEKLPFADGTFDLAFMGHVLHEADDVLTALQEAKRAATRRVVVLEWPYEVQEFGPPLEHRLKDEVIRAKAAEAGFARIEGHPLEMMMLYRLEIAG